MRAWALVLLCLVGRPLPAALPASVSSILPGLSEAERHLQDATLELEAARRDAEPVQAAVTDARAHASSFWGRWLLQRRLAELKQKLDKVEAGRVAQSRAREEVFTVLTGLEEELRSALETALSAKAKPPAGELQLWWRQKMAWSRRVEALEAGGDERVEAGGAERQRLLREARAEQRERDLHLLDALERSGALPAAEAATERKGMKADRQRWRQSARTT